VESVTRPEVRILRRYKDDINSITTSGKELERIFGAKIDEKWVQQALRLNDAAAFDSIKFRFESE